MPSRWASRQFESFHEFVIVNRTTGVAVESCQRLRQLSTARILNEHEQMFGREAVYEARALPFALRHAPPEMWTQLLDEALHSGDIKRESRSQKIMKLWRAPYPLVKSYFLNLAYKALVGSSDPKQVNWKALHDECLARCNLGDVRNYETVLNEILKLSPGAVTHIEQDLLCQRFDAAEHARNGMNLNCTTDALIRPSQGTS